MIGPAISASGITRILVATKPVDFRKQADSLAALVQDALGADPFGDRFDAFQRPADNGRGSAVPAGDPRCCPRSRGRLRRFLIFTTRRFHPGQSTERSLA